MLNALKKPNFLITILIAAWYIVPLVQERGGMLLIYALVALFVLTSGSRHLVSTAYRFLGLVPFLLVLGLYVATGTGIYNGITPIYFIASFLLVFIPFLVYRVLEEKFTEKEKALLLGFIYFFFIVGAVNTLIVLKQYPMASRMMAQGENGDVYSKMGAGGFGFVYSLMFFALIVVSRFKKAGRRERIVGLLSIVLFVYTIFECQYFTCILLLMIGGILVIAARSKRGVGFVVFCTVLILFIIALLFYGNAILKSVAGLFDEDGVINKRMLDLAELFDSRDVETMESSRGRLYMKSLSGFLSHPITGTGFFGTAVSGGHSTVLDTLSIYGLFGLACLVLPFWLMIREFRKAKVLNLAIVCVFVGLSFLNPTIYIYQFGAIVFLFAPLYANYTELQGEEESESGETETGVE